MEDLEWKEKFRKRLTESKYQYSTEIRNTVHLHMNEDEYYKKLEELNYKFLNGENIENPEDIEIFVNDESIPRKLSIINYEK